MRVTFLGTGTSRGVPIIGCTCPTCSSTDPRNSRLRSSILIESDMRVVIDASVDFRQQMLRHNSRELHAVILTHHHFDHVLGLDDIMPFNYWMRRPMPLYASPHTLKEVRAIFRHLFRPDRSPRVTQFEPNEIDGPFRIGRLTFEPVEVLHGKLPVLGFRIGRFAYVTDVSAIPEKSKERLQDLECLVIDGLRYKPHHTHFSIQEAVETAGELGAKTSYLIHMCHDVEHVEAERRLPPNIRLAFDGLVLDLESPAP